MAFRFHRALDVPCGASTRFTRALDMRAALTGPVDDASVHPTTASTIAAITAKGDRMRVSSGRVCRAVVARIIYRHEETVWIATPGGWSVLEAAIAHA